MTLTDLHTLFNESGYDVAVAVLEDAKLPLDEEQRFLETLMGWHMAQMANTVPAFADPNHPGNTIRPNVRCLGCGEKGCVTSWGDWCFRCNVARMTRISKALDRAEEILRRTA
jgi:hypothetical protein